MQSTDGSAFYFRPPRINHNSNSNYATTGMSVGNGGADVNSKRDEEVKEIHPVNSGVVSALNNIMGVQDFDEFGDNRFQEIPEVVNESGTRTP